MKKLLRRVCCTLAAPIALAASAASPQFNVLSIERTDGVIEHLQLDPAMKVKFAPEAIFIFHPQVTVEYALDEIADFKYENIDGTGLYDGDHKSAIDELVADVSHISISAEDITVNGSDDLVVYDLKGVEQTRAVSNGTRASVAVSQLPKGVYILRAGNTVLKIRI
ncbi:MAG: T9SS type A sorting domain-containing protein [Bacteroides sp.]|nr:T9SS type A sorting domain-containing protein [Bacteroides sp.]MCM1378765.1 T9SS type A sorting domain-containing protein [Bacteroides sp.]MCM1445382.1 T9SS type A sorting domain-containing protein [Prevotella sp.]